MKSMNIEFYGLPGSGKSTISHLVAEVLKKQNINVIEPSYDMDNNSKIIRIIKKMYKTIILYIFHHEDYRMLDSVIKSSNYHNKDILKQMSNIAYKYLYYLKEKKDNIVYIWDEGLVQSAISVSSLNVKIINNNLKKMTSNFNNILNIYIKVDKKVAFDRMKKRLKHESRVEQLSYEQKDDFINNIKYCCENIEYDIIIDNSNKEIKVDEIIKYIKDKVRS